MAPTDYKLIGTWDTSVDQICSLRINRCKGSLTPDEFVEVCRKVKGYRS